MDMKLFTILCPNLLVCLLNLWQAAALTYPEIYDPGSNNDKE